MPLVCLDNSVVNDIVWRGPEEWRNKVQRALRRRDYQHQHVLVIGTSILELARPLLDPRANRPDDIACKMREFYLSDVKVRLICQQPLERMQAEIDAAVAGEGRPFWKGLASIEATRKTLRVLLHDRASLEEAVEYLSHSKAAVAEQRQVRRAAQAEAPPGFDVAKADLEWLTSKDVEKMLAEHGLQLPEDKAKWPRNQDLPTLWYLSSVLWAYRILHWTQPERVEKSNDASDWLIYRDAAYANIFVTDDHKLHECIAGAPTPKAKVMWSKEWAATL